MEVTLGTRTDAHIYRKHSQIEDKHTFVRDKYADIRQECRKFYNYCVICNYVLRFTLEL